MKQREPKKLKFDVDYVPFDTRNIKKSIEAHIQSIQICFKQVVITLNEKSILSRNEIKSNLTSMYVRQLFALYRE